MSPFELFVRGTLTYFGLLFLLRIILRRQAGSMGLGDTLLVVLMADAAQNSMAGEYKSISEGLFLVATLVLWNYLIDWAAFHSRTFRQLLDGTPKVLIRDGHIQWANLESEGITEQELISQLRIAGIDHPWKAKTARLEVGGQISVVPKDQPHETKATEPEASSEPTADESGELAKMTKLLQQMQHTLTHQDAQIRKLIEQKRIGDEMRMAPVKSPKSITGAIIR